MNKELLDQAYQLYKTIDKRSWDAAISQNEILYNRYIIISQKALNRYERRFKKYTKNY
jgi:ribosomal protein L4